MASPSTQVLSSRIKKLKLECRSILEGVCFGYFLFLFLMKLKNDDGNALIEFQKILSVNIFSQINQRLKPIKSHFSLKPRNSFWIK